MGVPPSVQRMWAAHSTGAPWGGRIRASGGDTGTLDRPQITSTPVPSTTYVTATRPEPPPRKEHVITDDQLQVFLDTNRDKLTDNMLLFLGAALGVLPGVVVSFVRACRTPPTPLGVPEWVEILIFAVCLAIGGTLKLVGGKREIRANPLLRNFGHAIRQRNLAPRRASSLKPPQDR